MACLMAGQKPSPWHTIPGANSGSKHVQCLPQSTTAILLSSMGYHTDHTQFSNVHHDMQYCASCAEATTAGDSNVACKCSSTVGTGVSQRLAVKYGVLC